MSGQTGATFQFGIYLSNGSFEVQQEDSVTPVYPPMQGMSGMWSKTLTAPAGGWSKSPMGRNGPAGDHAARILYGTNHQDTLNHIVN